MDVEHAALKTNTAIRTGSAWLYAEAARTILGMAYDTFVDTVPRDEQITVIAQYEIKWRLDAIHEWERAQEIEARSKHKPKKGKK